jgi:hypothetical protein
MSVRMRGKCYYVSFRWKKNRMDSATSATTITEAKRIEKAVRIAFNIYRFDHLDSASLEVALKLFKNKDWKLPHGLQTPEPEEELTLLRAIKDYIKF